MPPGRAEPSTSLPARPGLAPPPRCVPPRPDPPVVCPGFGLGKWIPGHALHEKGLQRQIAVGTLVNSQQRRALLVPLINRGSTGRFVPPPVYIGFPLFVLAKRRSEQLFTVSWRARETVGFLADRNVGTVFCPASLRPAVRSAPRRRDPPVVCPGFGLDRFPDMPCMKRVYGDK